MKIVTFTTALPHAAIEHAGGKYLNLLLTELDKSHVVTVVAPPLPSVLRASALDGHPRNTLITDGVPARISELEGLSRRIDPGQPSWALRRAVTNSKALQHLVQAADVVDLQWQDSIRLAGTIRRLNPGSTMVGTFHDVQSQKFSRLARSSRGRASVKWWAAAQVAKTSERRAMRSLDRVVVFSEKDAALLPSGAPVTVVDPPLAPETLPRHRPPEQPRVTFVAFLVRPENESAAVWLVEEVWPKVRGAVHDAQLDLVGAGATESLKTRVASVPGVRITGYVDDLDGVMTSSTVVAVPLHDGAGVKFKTIEALVAGVPVVTTTVGAEGIRPASLFHAVTDDAEKFADALSETLRDPHAAQARADSAQQLIAQRYGGAGFSAKVASIYEEVGSIAST